MTRGLLLFVNFFFIIFAYYLIKPASRSIYLEHFRADQLPYVWIASALVLGLLMIVYSRFIERFDRRYVVVTTCLIFCLLLGLAGEALNSGMNAAFMAVGFYILVDILSVVLVEQFWSLTNGAYATESGSRWYGIVGSGGLVGGIVGGLAANWLIKQAGFHTFDLVIVGAGFLLVLALYVLLLIRLSILGEQNTLVTPPGIATTFRLRHLFVNRYLFSIMTIILLAQLVEPIVEYQFMSHVESAYAAREDRTAYLSTFLSLLGGVALVINLLLTPLILYFVGAIGGLLMQPITLFMTSALFSQQADLSSGALLKISDRGLSYSINRASKEMLYVPVDPDIIYHAKAWIDMFGYRLFKIIGALLVLFFTQWFGFNWSSATFSYLVMPICLLWLVTVFYLRTDYRMLREREQAAQLSTAA